MKTIKKVTLILYKCPRTSQRQMGCEIDSYYAIMEDRISKYKDAEDFDPILYK